MYDIVIKNGILINPEKCTQTIGNIGITEGVIKVITRREIEGKEVIDAYGKIVSPGFIDAHTHIDGHLENGKLMALQGVTTVVNGHCGIGPLQLQDYFNKQNTDGFIINQIQFVGHTALREEIGVIDPYIPLNSTQIEEINFLLEDEFKSGAAGLSFGLEYVPGTSEEEIITLSKTAAKYGKPVSVHSRKDGWEGLALSLIHI